VLVFGPRADDAARGDFHYEIKREAAHTGSGGSGRGSGSGWRDGGMYGASSHVETVKLSDPELFDRLRELRSAIAKESGKPPYVVFNDRSLREMAELKPTDADAFLAINGVGERKLEAYGERFMEAIRGYMADKG
jgi:ATP-dependent DNA helicase RecQ